MVAHSRERGFRFESGLRIYPRKAKGVGRRRLNEYFRKWMIARHYKRLRSIGSQNAEYLKVGVIGLCCNGSKGGFDPLSLGSNPSEPTRFCKLS